MGEPDQQYHSNCYLTRSLVLVLLVINQPPVLAKKSVIMMIIKLTIHSDLPIAATSSLENTGQD